MTLLTTCFHTLPIVDRFFKSFAPAPPCTSAGAVAARSCFAPTPSAGAFAPYDRSTTDESLVSGEPTEAEYALYPLAYDAYDACETMDPIEPADATELTSIATALSLPFPFAFPPWT